MSSCARKVNGIEVCFPFETPYPAQMMVASKVLSALQKGQVCAAPASRARAQSLTAVHRMRSWNPRLEQVLPLIGGHYAAV